MVIEDAESVDAQREILVKFLLEKKHVGFERAVRVTTALLGPSECDVYCQRIPNSTDEEIQLFRSMESFAANSALFGLFELGVLEYVDDAVRVTALVDDAAVLEDGAVRTAASLDDVASLGDDLGRGARRTPSSGPLKNASGDLDEAAHARRTQPHGPTPEATGGNSPELQVRPDVRLKGGRSGQNVKNLVGPPNSVVRGGGSRVFITNERGEVILDITRDRVKPVTPGRGFGPKRPPSEEELHLLDQVLGSQS